MNRIYFKEASDEDIELLSRICRSNEDLYHPIMPGALTRQAEKFEKNGLPKNYAINMIVFDNAVIGFVGLKSLSADIEYLVALYIDRLHQNKRYGSQIVTMLEDRLRQNGKKEVLLLVHQEALWARKFYEKTNYMEIHHDQVDICLYKDGVLRELWLQDTILMGKAL